MVLYNGSAVLGGDYVGRLRVSEKLISLHSVRMTDEGSFAVLDREGHTRMRNCLNVRGEGVRRSETLLSFIFKSNNLTFFASTSSVIRDEFRVHVFQQHL